MKDRDTGPKLWDPYQVEDKLGEVAAATFTEKIRRLDAAIDKTEKDLAKLRAERQLVDRRAKAAAAIVAKIDLSAALAVQEYDPALRKLASAPLQMVDPNHWNKKTRRTEKAPTGAIAWAELMSHGASDEQIEKNLLSTGKANSAWIGTPLADGYKIGREGLGRAADGYTNWFLSGKKLVAEVRRVLEIPQPGKGKAAASPKAAAKAATPAKKKPAKPAAKAKAAGPGDGPLAAAPEASLTSGHVGRNKPRGNLRTWCDQVREQLSPDERKALGGRLRELKEWKDRHAAGMSPPAAATDWRSNRPVPGSNPEDLPEELQEADADKLEPTADAIPIESTNVTEAELSASAGEIWPADLTMPLSRQQKHEATIGTPVRIRGRLWALGRTLTPRPEDTHCIVVLQELTAPDPATPDYSWGERRRFMPGPHAYDLPLNGVRCRAADGTAYVFGAEQLRIAVPLEPVGTPIDSPIDTTESTDAPNPADDIPEGLLGRARDVCRQAGRCNATLLARQLEIPLAQAIPLAKALKAEMKPLTTAHSTLASVS